MGIGTTINKRSLIFTTVSKEIPTPTSVPWTAILMLSADHFTQTNIFVDASRQISSVHTCKQNQLSIKTCYYYFIIISGLQHLSQDQDTRTTFSNDSQTGRHTRVHCNTYCYLAQALPKAPAATDTETTLTATHA